jgi:nitrite reductase/ring-hydroxylating ferredoxin subunit
MYQRLCDVSEVSPGKMKQFDLKDREFLVANIAGRFYCLDGMCTHAGARSSKASLQEMSSPAPSTTPSSISLTTLF